MSTKDIFDAFEFMRTHLAEFRKAEESTPEQERHGMALEFGAVAIVETVVTDLRRIAVALEHSNRLLSQSMADAANIIQEGEQQT